MTKKTILKFARDPFARARLAAGRERIAFDRLKRRGPCNVTAPMTGGMSMLIHPSTKRRGWWQASFFDKAGDPFGDQENASWLKLLDGLRLSGVRWRSARCI